MLIYGNILFLCILIHQFGIDESYLFQRSIFKKPKENKNFNYKNILKKNIFKIYDKVPHELLKELIYYHSFSKGILKSIFNDPDMHLQWYFVKQNSSEKTLSHELDKVWSLNIIGKGVTIGLIDGGIETYHKELVNRFIANFSFNFLNSSTKITPSQFGRPTRSAGLILAEANNNKCGVGAAPGSKFANLQIFDDNNSILKEIRVKKAILYMRNYIDIYVFNWARNYKLEIRSIPGIYLRRALKSGSIFGRNFFGSIYVIGSGVFKNKGNNCGFNGYVQRPEIFAFGSVSPDGTRTYYSEGCTGVLAAALSTLEFYSKDQIYTTTSNNMCRKSMTGLAASVSISSGIIALLLSHSPGLTARQILILIIISSKQLDSMSILNAAGYRYSYYFGFGLLNANELIRLSSTDAIKKIQIEKICSTKFFKGNHLINRRSSKVFSLYFSGCLNADFCVTKIEQVYVTFTLSIFKRRAVKIFLTSPSGTKFQIIQPRLFDNSRNGFSKWTIKILGYFGERPSGLWKLKIFTNTTSCKLLDFALIVHGTCDNSKSNFISDLRVQIFFLKNKKYNLKTFSSVASDKKKIFDGNKGYDEKAIFGTFPYYFDTINILS